jgi:hypothetical protein
MRKKTIAKHPRACGLSPHAFPPKRGSHTQG